MRQPSLIPKRPPVPDAVPIIVYGPFVLNRPDRPVPIELRVSFPATGRDLPVLLCSHGHAGSNYLSSVRGYAPLTDFWAAHGFAVIQVTHLDSATLALDPTGPEGATFWRSRAIDISALIDRLDEIQAAVPSLTGRLDASRLGIVGHPLGGQTVTLLSGARMTYIHSGEIVDLTEVRLGAAIAIAPPGDGRDLAEFAGRRYPELRGVDLSTMHRRVLLLTGDRDFNDHFSTRRDWRSDGFFRAPAPKTLVTVFGGEHMLGGIAGWDVAETSDENPSRLAEVQRLTWASLRSALVPSDSAWERVAQDFEARGLGRIQSK